MNNTLSVNVSIDDIMKRIYAASALRFFQNSGTATQPAPMLTRDQQPALRLQVIDSFAHITLRLLEHIERTNLKEAADEENDILTIDFNTPAGFSQSCAQTLLQSVEHAIAMDALSLCYAGHDEKLSLRHETLARESIDHISSLFSGHTAVHIYPSWL